MVLFLNLFFVPTGEGSCLVLETTSLAIMTPTEYIQMDMMRQFQWSIGTSGTIDTKNGTK